MAKEKQHVFSARTTEAGLKALNEVKSCFNIGWDELVIDAVSAHYNMDKAMMTLPRKEKPIIEAQPTEQQAPAETAEELPTEEKLPAKKHKGKKKGAKVQEAKQ